MKQTGLPLLLKTVCDRVVALGLLAVAAPVVAVAGVAVRATMGSPVFFRQERPGKNEAPFRIYKMRTMTDERGLDGHLLSDAARLTPLGKFMRATSIDELPQLVNVLAGNLSLVGPRPLLNEYLPLYSREQARRHDVLPGITGWAQVHGRNATTWEERLRLDVWYVDNWSPWLDVRILVKTAIAVVRRDGIAQEGQATMERFRGHTKTANDARSLS